MTSASRPSGNAVQQLLQHWRQQLARRQPARAAGNDGEPPGELLAYYGSWQDPIPRELIVDRVLRPADKLVWQVLRTRIGDPRQPVASPGHADIARDANVSRNTVRTALTALRLQGWIVVHGGQVRSEHAADRGRFRQQTYMLHDHPPTMADRIDLSSMFGSGYLQFVQESARHPSRHVRAIACGLLDHLRGYILDGTGPLAEQPLPSVYALHQHADADQAAATERIRRRMAEAEAGDLEGENEDEDAFEDGSEDTGDGMDEDGVGADEGCASRTDDPGLPADPAPPAAESVPANAPEAVDDAAGDELAAPVVEKKYVSVEQKIAEIQRKNTTKPACQNLRTAQTAENPVFEPCANFEHGLLSSSSSKKDTTTVHARNTHALAREACADGPTPIALPTTAASSIAYWLPPDVQTLLSTEELAMIASSLETILEGPRAALRQIVIDEWAGQVRLEVQGLRDPNDPIHYRCRYLRGMALRAARPGHGRASFNLTQIGEAIGEERRRAQAHEPAPAAVPPTRIEAPVESSVTACPATPAASAARSPKPAHVVRADPGALRHAREMAAEWGRRVEKAAEAARDFARRQLDFWQTEVLRLSANIRPLTEPHGGCSA